MFPSDTICTILYQSLPVLVTTSSDGSMKAWTFPHPETPEREAGFEEDGGEDEDISGIEPKEEKEIALKTTEPLETEGDEVMTDVTLKKEKAPFQTMIVKNHVTSSAKVHCTNLLFVNGRLISCGKTPDSFVHWNFVCICSRLSS